ncbi:hypothetical protein GCM10010116_36180 [Microbispora rosea subsp. aerata]|nr:hypothetical protein [Microbispora rosea]GGO17938.1 hypothetical protein GCM10010116_36180 [Microbispora rosea subsp. aerata]GIH56746.1 hypothetical protein Mro02_36600 [Microbispora rosea subsp. aerata]GLJ82119.1 hypothetical protein GCM10017588_08440 [Microbispora rosea subsp. aerata]
MRRVPGLRREEVAFLAGVSTGYYARPSAVPSAWTTRDARIGARERDDRVVPAVPAGELLRCPPRGFPSETTCAAAAQAAGKSVAGAVSAVASTFARSAATLAVA